MVTLEASSDRLWCDLLAECEHSRIIGSGVTRTVYSVSPGSVLKVARSFGEYGPEWGCGANRDEAENYSRATELQRRFLAPVLSVSVDCSWLSMARCTPFRSHAEMVSRHSHYEYDMLCATLEELGIEDLHSCNLGTFDGSLVALDYAS